MLGYPAVQYDENLPIVSARAELIQAIREHPVIVVAGETGSGKSTQLPKMCLEAGRGQNGLIGHTQPRRIATHAIANRLCEELKVIIGQEVGSEIRFQRKISAKTIIKVMTDGILLTEIQKNKWLKTYDTIIIDEAHERSLNIDLILGHLKWLINRRPDLKVIITSATIDPEKFSRFFNNAPMFSVSGRMYPVSTRYFPVDPENEQKNNLLEAIEEARRCGPGDMLIFFPGEKDIRDAMQDIRQAYPTQFEVLPLFARLSAREQQQIFSHGKLTRIILATNIAETSLTVPGIRYVIDTGIARMARYSYRTKVQRLPIEPISQASADQRKGRCGRVQSGICFRLYSEEDFNLRPAFTEPEILRTNLASVLLKMAAFNLGNIDTFAFLDPPDPRFVRDAIQLLQEMGAFDSEEKLTKTGKIMAQFPIEPRLARMLIAASHEQCLTEALIVISGLAIQDPRDRPIDKRAQADQKHAEFQDPMSDFAGLQNIWNAYQVVLKTESRNQARKFCKENYLSYVRMHEWEDVHAQLTELVAEQHWRLNQNSCGYDALHRAILTGLITRVAMKQVDQFYQGVRGTKLKIFYNSGIRKKSPDWIMAAEFLETDFVFALICARIDPEWIELLAKHLIKYHYSEPHWQPKSGRVAAFETAMLFGLSIIPKRRINYGPRDIKTAHEIFLQALVADEVQCDLPFIQHNRLVLEKLMDLETRSRKQQLLLDEVRVMNFYAKQIPETVYDVESLKKWWRENEKSGVHEKLMITQEDIYSDHTQEIEWQFPQELVVNDKLLALKYVFEPQQSRDGVQITLTARECADLQKATLDYHVPGLLQEKIEALLRTLPKNLRKSIVPIPDTAKKCYELLGGDRTIPLTDRLSLILLKNFHIQTQPSDWNESQLPDYLRMLITVVDQDKKILIETRDFAQAKKAALERESINPHQEIRFKGELTGLKSWTVGDIPEEIIIVESGNSITRYPALIDEHDAVALRYFPDAQRAQELHFNGVARLVFFGLQAQLPQIKKQNTHAKALALLWTWFCTESELLEQILQQAIDTLMQQMPLPRKEGEFQQLFAQIKSKCFTEVHSVINNLLKLGKDLSLIRQKLPAIQAAFPAEYQDLQHQIKHLFTKQFIAETPPEWFKRLPAYSAAILLRLDKIAELSKRSADEIVFLKNAYQKYEKSFNALNQYGLSTRAIQRYRWLLEEYRLSVFAQSIRTTEPISRKRLEKVWENLPSL
jgi:ATP-dependent helicase HrpA